MTSKTRPEQSRLNRRTRSYLEDEHPDAPAEAGPETTPGPAGARRDRDARRTVLYADPPRLLEPGDDEHDDDPSYATASEPEPAAHRTEELPVIGSDGGSVRDTYELRPGRAYDRRYLGRYRILTQYGNGAMSRVYRAEDADTSQVVAIKLLSEPERWDRIREEIDALRAIDHPNVMKIIDIDQDRGMAVLVMELVQGRTLRTILESSRLEWQQSARIALATLEGLEAVHRSGLVHRNVQPSNLVVTDLDQARLKIIDFDLVRPLDPQRRTTSLGVYVGTPTYMPPEQLMGLDVDGSADVYSVGMVLWQMLTGLDPAKLALSTVEGKLRLWQQVMELEEPGVPEPLWDLVREMLQPLATRRLGDVRACIDVLRPVVAQGQVQSGPRSPADATTRLLG